MKHKKILFSWTIDDDFMDTDETIQHIPPPPNAYDIPTSMNSTTSNDIMVTIPYVQNSDASQNRVRLLLFIINKRILMMNIFFFFSFVGLFIYHTVN